MRSFGGVAGCRFQLLTAGWWLVAPHAEL